MAGRAGTSPKNTLLIKEMDKILEGRKFTAKQAEDFKRFAERMSGKATSKPSRKAATPAKA